MFQFPTFPPHGLCVHPWVTAHYHCRVSPFGYLWVKACLRLTIAFRSLPRPSSAPSAKASSLRSDSLDRFLISVSFDEIVAMLPHCLSFLLPCLFSFLFLCSCQGAPLGVLTPYGSHHIWWARSARPPVGLKHFASLRASLPPGLAAPPLLSQLSLLGGLKWTRTTDLTLIRRAL